MSPSATQPINQCDGCRRGLPLRANGIHYEDKPFPDAMPVMGCTKDRYTPSTAPSPYGHTFDGEPPIQCGQCQRIAKPSFPAKYGPVKEML